jgi:hypothetical protein
MPETYDEWFTTPLHNVYAYYSNVGKVMICSNSRTPITSNVGTLTLQDGCFVDTTRQQIKGTKDRSKTQKHVFKVDVDIDFTAPKEHKYANLHRTNNLSTINLSTLEEVAAEASAVENYSVVTIVLIVAIAFIFIFAVALVTYNQYLPCCKPIANLGKQTNEETAITFTPTAATEVGTAPNDEKTSEARIIYEAVPLPRVRIMN